MDTQKKEKIDDVLASIDNAKNYDEAYSNYMRAISLLNTIYYNNLKRHNPIVWDYPPAKLMGISKEGELAGWKEVMPGWIDPRTPYLPLAYPVHSTFGMGANIPLNYEKQFAEINSQLSEITQVFKQIESIKQDLAYLQKENLALKEANYILITESTSSEKIQFLRVEIYLDTNDADLCFKVYTEVMDFLKSIEFERAFEFEPIKGSWFKRIVAKSQKAITSEQVTDRLKEAEYGIEVNTILKQQSEIDKNQSEALLNILSSVDKIPNAAIRIGALLVVKVTSTEGAVNVQVRTLSIKELHLLNKKPELLSNPQQVLTALTQEIENND